jgi:hypothetical protein
MRGFGFSRLFEVDLNDFEIERILADVFYLVVSHGRQRGKTPNDPKAIGSYRDALAGHALLDGFDGELGRDLLDGWLRAAVIRTSSLTRRQTGEQIDFLRPLNVAVYKAGFPDNYRQRNIPGFLYSSLIEAIADVDEQSRPARIEQLFIQALGPGVRVGEAPSFEPTYDGSPALDIHVLLALLYLDGFEPVLASARKPRPDHSAALPGQAQALGQRLLRYLEAYGQALPAPALSRGFLALANLELFVYSAKLFAGTVSLVRDGTLPPAMNDVAPSPPELYCDFTGMRGSVSDELARACVERDLEGLGAFSEALIRLRTIERYARRSTTLADELDAIGPNTPQYLLALYNLKSHERVQQWAEFEYERIRDETIRALGEDVRTAVVGQFEAARRTSGDSLEPTITLLAGAQRRHISHLTAWFQSAGGLKSPYGLVSGKVRSRSGWRYVVSDDLLATLVLLAYVDPAAARQQDERLPLQSFLSYLERSYGLVIDRPPRFMDGTTARAGARENLAAMKRKLRQMNFFSELSDDFSAQYLTLPVQARQ